MPVPGALAGRAAVAALALALALAAPASAQQAPARAGQLPPGSLAVRVGDAWQTWWRAPGSPVRWTKPHATVQRAVLWDEVRPGLERAELQLSGAGLVARFRVLLVRLDPARYRLRLRQATRDYGLKGAWNLDSAAAEAVLATNAGQFTGGDPWGWLVREGKELQRPGGGPLALGVILDGEPGFALLEPAELPRVRARGNVREAFQSYPALLVGDGEIPGPLRAPGQGVDLEHRDARLALCTLRDSRLLLALTRYSGMGEVLATLPVGPTTPEMAALMGALGCSRAVMLDGGLSSQLLLRDAAGLAELWPGLRRVPLALEALPRD